MICMDEVLAANPYSARQYAVMTLFGGALSGGAFPVEWRMDEPLPGILVSGAKGACAYKQDGEGHTPEHSVLYIY